ncbi:hypothetical protein BDZ89DRAFT_1234616 [Hymenopellis radicata]|nr:hypothetical protein BDZ89DRAFT_1234616 [Hymenopellis radicata]
MALTSSAKPHISTTPWGMPLNRSASIDEQKTQRADLQRFRERVQSMDSAVRRLPQEIWQEVFLFVRAHGEWVDIFDLRDSVYTVGQVCQQWRRASPRLWSRILVLVSRLVDVPQGESHLRTGSRLDFGLDCGRRIVSAPETHARMLSVLMQHSSRWRSAEFSEMSLKDAVLLENVRGHVPQLESITLSEVCWERAGSERIVTSAFEIAPKLVRVDLHFVTLEQLTTVDLYCTSALDVFDWPAPPPSEAPRSVYPNVTSLRVVEGDSGLNFISLPNLIDLNVGMDHSDLIQGLLPCVIGLLQHSRCRLTSLHLHHAKWDEKLLGVLFGLVPDLETLLITFLELGLTNRMSMLMRFLGEKGDDGSQPKYVPRLKTLGIYLSGWSDPKPGGGLLARCFWIWSLCEVVRLRGDSRRLREFPHSGFDDWERWNDMSKRGLIDVLVVDYNY